MRGISPGNLREPEFQVDLFDHAAHRAAVNALNDADAVVGISALLAEAKHINAGAGADGCKEYSKGCRRAGTGGWSVITVWGPKWASTRAPPGKSIIISFF